MSSLKDLADKVIDNINAGTWSLPFVSERTLRPLDTLESLDDDIKIYAVPSSQSNAVESRGKGKDEYSVQVGLLARIVDGARTEEQLIDFSDELWESFKNNHLPSKENIEYYWMSVRQDFLYDYEDRDANYVFKSVFVLTYKVWKPW